MVGFLACVLRGGGGHDGPEFALVSLVVSPDPHVVMLVVVGDSDVFPAGHGFDPISSAILFEDEALVGSSMETVEDQVAIVGHVLGNVDALQTVPVHCVNYEVLVWSKVHLWHHGHLRHHRHLRHHGKHRKRRLLIETHPEIVAKIGSVGELGIPVEALPSNSSEEMLGIDDKPLPLLSLLLFGFRLNLFGFVGFLQEGLDEPDFAPILSEVVLDDWLSFDGLASSDVESFSVGVGLDDVALGGEGSVFRSGNFEPAAVVFAGVRNHGGQVVLLVSEDAESVLVGSYKGVFVFFEDDCELLVIGATEVLDDHFAFLGVHCQGFLLVEDRNNPVGNAGIGFEVSWHVGHHDFFKQPHLVAIFMELVLYDGLVIFSLASRDVQGLGAGVSHDDVALVGEGPLLSPHDIEPTAEVFA